MTDGTGVDAHPTPEGAQRFAYHRQLSPLLWALLAIATVEAGVVHLLLFHWLPAVALAILALSVLAMLWLVALLISFRKHPVELGENGLRVRTGFLVDTHVPLDEIAFAQSGFAPADYAQGSLLKASLLAYPNAVVLLRRDIVLPGPFGRRKMVHAVALALDEPTRFLAAVKQRLEATPRQAA
jgi:hypothetical protein